MYVYVFKIGQRPITSLLGKTPFKSLSCFRFTVILRICPTFFNLGILGDPSGCSSLKLVPNPVAWRILETETFATALIIRSLFMIGLIKLIFHLSL